MAGEPILVVDDNPANRYAFEAVLEKNYQVVVAESGEEAVEQCRHQDFAVVVLDVRMPGMDGFETAEALRRMERTSSTPIIFTSAYEQTIAQMTRGYVAGATDFLFSPVDSELLKLKVGTYVQIYQRHELLRQKVQELNQSLRILHAELARRGIAVTRLRDQMKQVEQDASELTRQASDLT